MCSHSLRCSDTAALCCHLQIDFNFKKIKLNLLLISNKISTYSTSQFTRVCFTSTYLKLQTKMSPSERSLTGIWMLPLGVLQPVHLRWQSGASALFSARASSPSEASWAAKTESLTSLVWIS